MSKRIWKWPLVGALDEESMPKGTTILCVQMQTTVPTIWALVDTEQMETERRRFRIYGTGREIPSESGIYIGTVQNGPFVWHIFEEKEEQENGSV